MRRLRFLPVIVAALLLCAAAFNAAYAASYFKITDYDIKMVVNEDDTYEITESVDVHFTYPQHGIYRSIPLRSTLDRDGQKTTYTASIKNFTMLSGQPWEDESSSNIFKVRIGDADKLVEEDATYTFSYTYDTGGDHFSGGDEFYMDIVGSYWEAMSIDHVSFEITFPKDIDMSKVGIKTGKGEYVSFDTPDKRTIKGQTSLNTLSGLSVRAVLPDGYFTRQAKSPVWFFYIVTGILAALTAVGFVLWRKYGRDPVYAKTLEFYPPDGLSAPETAYLSKGSLDRTDIVSMLLSLADRGYIKIYEKEAVTGKRKKKSKDKYEFEKLREYDGDVIGEQTFMDDLFVGGRTVAKLDDLEDEFYKTLDKIKKEIEDRYKGKLYDEKASKYAKIMYLAGAIGFVILTLAAKLAAGVGLLEGGVMITLAQIMLPVIGFYAMAGCIMNKPKISGVIVTVILIAVGMFFCWMTDLFYGAQAPLYIIGILLSALLFIMGGLCEKKTDWYAEIRARISGYEDFLKTAEKDKIEEIAETDPGYFYRNLAFASALGISAVYARNFMSMAKDDPDWYDTYHHYPDGFDAGRMTNSIDSMMTHVSTGMASSPSDGSGGGSFSGGGGGGGGGGGSW